MLKKLGCGESFGEGFNYALKSGILCFLLPLDELHWEGELIEGLELWDSLSFDPGTLSVSWALNPI